MSDAERLRELRARVGQLEHELEWLRARLAYVQDTLGMLIGWMSQSANSPINRDEAQRLLERLYAGKEA